MWARPFASSLPSVTCLSSATSATLAVCLGPGETGRRCSASRGHTLDFTSALPTRSCRATPIKPKRNKCGRMRTERGVKGTRQVWGGDKPLLSAGPSDRDRVPIGAGGATFCRLGDTGQKQCLLDPYLLPVVPCRLGAQLLGAGSARRGGAAAGGRGWSQSLTLAVGTRGALRSGRCEAQMEDPWTPGGWAQFQSICRVGRSSLALVRVYV